MSERWRLEKQVTYPDLIWGDEGDRQNLIAEVHIPDVAEQIVRDHNAALTDAAQSIDLNDRLHKAEREAATFLNQLLAANKRADQAAAELAAARAEVEQLTAERDAWRELADNVLGPWTQLADDPYNKHWIERFGLTVVYPEWEAEYRRLMALSTAPATARPGQEGACTLTDHDWYSLFGSDRVEACRRCGGIRFPGPDRGQEGTG